MSKIKNDIHIILDSNSENLLFKRNVISKHFNTTKCLEHCNSDTFYIKKEDRRIKRGQCLGHSTKGCITYSGIDIDTGKLLYISEWNIKYTQIEAKCLSNCFWFNNFKCNGHKIDDFIKSVEKHVMNLSRLHHKNLLSYNCVLCLKKKSYLIIYLVQDFAFGNNIYTVTNSIGWSIEGVRVIVKGVLNALTFLNSKGLKHGFLYEKTVFLDSSGHVKCSDFTIVPHLFQLTTNQNQSNPDLLSLGCLMESFLDILPCDGKNFIDKCKSDQEILISQLRKHRFLRSSSISNEVVSQSRLKTEFEVLQYHEKGAFGDVLKVRNILDKREYAIKRIPLSVRSEKLYEKMRREVELLSRLNHINVVRYFNSWIENATSAELDDIDTVANENSIGRDTNVKFNSVKSTKKTSNLLNDLKFKIDDSDSGGIVFVNSNNEIELYNEPEVSEHKIKLHGTKNLKHLDEVMYIQMEFCEKSTLREAIDENLCENTVRLWQLFREILEGLSYIHQQGIIHRDLKPVNIFLDSSDQIKIGDFGLATSSFFVLESDEPINLNNETKDDIISGETGKVGTTLYIAPELTGHILKSTYNQKVDMYTLGIILFEMSNPPFETAMERVKTITALRSKDIVLPEKMIKYAWSEQNDIIRWLLKHNPTHRPTAKELLDSKLMLEGNFKAYVASEANFK